MALTSRSQNECRRWSGRRGHDYGVRGVSSRELLLDGQRCYAGCLADELPALSILALICSQGDGSRRMRMRAVASRMRARAIWVGVRAHHLSDSRIAGIARKTAK